MNKIATTLLFVIFLSSNAQQFPLTRNNFSAKNFSAVIPYENIKDKIIIPVTIGGKVRRFVVDTGAPMVISEALFKELGLAVQQQHPITDANNRQSMMTITTIDKFSIGSLEFSDVASLVTSDTTVTSCLKVDGLIGSPVLRHCTVQFASDRNELILTDNLANLKLQGVPSSDIAFDAAFMPYIKIRFGKKTSETVLFDSGDGSLYQMGVNSFKNFRRKKIYQINAVGFGATSMGMHGLADYTELYRLSIPSLSVNGTTLPPQLYRTTNDVGSRIGASLLRYGKVTVDYIHQRFYFEPFENVSEPPLQNWTLTPVVREGKFIVGAVWNGVKDVKPGDEIVGIEGLNLSDIDFCNAGATNLFAGKTKAVLTIRDQNGNAKKVVTESF